jgi:ribonuclease HII
MKKNPSFELELQLDGFVAGIDEAGCGPWAGPVVAACVVFKSYDTFDLGKLTGQVFDSKQMTKSNREKVFSIIQEHSHILFGVGQASVDEIDINGLGKATKIAMHRAFQKITCDVNHILVDGIRNPNIAGNVHMIVKGDQKSFSIACASILAKVTRDRIMDDLHQQYPLYGWHTNAGYGTKSHNEAIKKHGITEHHRRSFAPIQAFLKTV